MVAYSFKKRFVPKIEDRSKSQTIRSERTGRTRHARPGERIQLYFGMRTKHCFKIIDDPVCKRVESITIDVPKSSAAPAFYRFPGRPDQPQRMIDDDFARLDGFDEEDIQRAFRALNGQDDQITIRGDLKVGNIVENLTSLLPE